jgi:uncharacterized protein (TIGR02300 family)
MSNVARSELGTKRVCPKTGKKFYDLDKDPIVSPYTGDVIPRSFYEPQISKAAALAAVATAAAAAAAAARPVPTAEDDGDLPVDDGTELLSLEEADEEQSATGKAEVALEDDIEVDDELVADDDDTFLEEEEEDAGDVSDLIDGDIEDDEEV